MNYKNQTQEHLDAHETNLFTYKILAEKIIDKFSDKLGTIKEMRVDWVDQKKFLYSGYTIKNANAMVLFNLETIGKSFNEVVGHKISLEIKDWREQWFMIGNVKRFGLYLRGLDFSSEFV